MKIHLAAEAIVSDLRAAGLAAALDPRDINPPAVWVQVDTVHLDGFDASVWRGDWVLLAIAPDVGTLGALRILSELAEKIHDAFPTAGPATAQAVTLPSGGDPLPGLRLPLALKATDDPDDPEPPP